MILTRERRWRLCVAREQLRACHRAPARSIEAIARDAGMSSFHFIRQFHAVFGVTPHQDRIDARLDRAKRLLASGRSVTEVCFDVGCESLGSFSDLFGRRVGEPPSAFQRRMRAMVAVPGAVPPALMPGCLLLMAHLPADAFRSFQEAPRHGI